MIFSFSFRRKTTMKSLFLFLFLVLFGMTTALADHVHASKKVRAHKEKTTPKANLDFSGKPRTGKASYYSHKFAGKKMADGTPMNPKSNVAASKTLPLGTKAKVTNLENGKSSVVEIKDRGPYVQGRIVDLSPNTAKKLNMEKQGVASVEVTPVTVPQPDGSVKQVPPPKTK
jgi:rare lipoprotein A